MIKIYNPNNDTIIYYTTIDHITLCFFNKNNTNDLRNTSTILSSQTNGNP